MAATTARRGWAALWVVSLLLVAGCAEEDGPAPVAQEAPAAAAGPACQLIEYDLVAEHLGTRFDTAGGASKGKTISCALTQAGRDYPDLVLAITDTDADEIIFRATQVPSGATAVKGLGEIAYRLTIAAKGKRGPAVEIGWLSKSERIIVVRYTFAPEAVDAEVDALPAKLIALAKNIDKGPPPLA